MELKPRFTLSYPTHKVSVIVSRRSVVDMASRPTSKAVTLSGTYWSPPRKKILWSTKVETSRTFGERYKEHLKGPSPIHQHSNHTGHPTNHNNFQIMGREGHNLPRNIEESIFIRVNNPTLNRNIGKFNLPHIWDMVLLNTPGLNLKRPIHTFGHVNPNNPKTPI